MLAVQLIKSKIATVKDLGKLLFLQSIVTEKLKNTERMVFAAFVATIKVLDKSVIKCTLREFCRELSRLGVAHTSPDTIRRSLLRLEELKYCTIDRRRDGLSIIINIKAMAYWTRAKTSNVIPLPTSISIPYLDTQKHTNVHNSYPLANCEGDLGREINSRVNSCNSCSYPTRAKQNKYSNWIHPILFTLSMILKGAPDREKILAKSDLELRALSAGIELTHPSGVPWEHYARHWQELDPRSGGPREILARNEIIPVLRGITPVKPRAIDMHPIEKCEDENNYPEVSPEDIAGIRAKIREYLEQNSVIQPIEPNNIRSEHLPPNEIDETDPEMKILLDARDRTRARRINDSEGII